MPSTTVTWSAAWRDFGAVMVVIVAGERLRTPDCGLPPSGRSAPATEASRWFVSAVRSPQSRSFHDHRVPHAPGRADGEQAELAVASYQLVAERRENAAARCAERVAERDR